MSHVMCEYQDYLLISRLWWIKIMVDSHVVDQCIDKFASSSDLGALFFAHL